MPGMTAFPAGRPPSAQVTAHGVLGRLAAVSWGTSGAATAPGPALRYSENRASCHGNGGLDQFCHCSGLTAAASQVSRMVIWPTGLVTPVCRQGRAR